MTPLTPQEINWNVPPDPMEIEQLREVAKLPYWEKLKWLAQAGRMADHLQKQHAERMNQRRHEQSGDENKG
jgi:hypothetical protein